MDKEYEKGRKEMVRKVAAKMFELGYPLESVEIMMEEELSRDEIMQISETTQHGILNPTERKRIIATKKLEMRQFRHSSGEVYYCLVYDVTEEIREMFGVPIKEAFAVYRKDDTPFENPPKTKNVAYEESIQIPDMEEIYVVFDDDHVVCFWASEWGGIKRTSLDNIDFGDYSFAL